MPSNSYRYGVEEQDQRVILVPLDQENIVPVDLGKTFIIA